MGQKVKEEPKPDFKAAYVPPNVSLMINEWDEGAEIGEPCRIPAIDHLFSWKRGFINCWTGWENDGKSQGMLYMMLLRAKMDNQKICIWSPEMMSSHKNGKEVQVSGNDIYNDLVWMLTGQTPYKHIALKHRIQQLPLLEYQEAIDFISQHFYVIYPKDRSHKGIMEAFMFYYEMFGIDIFLADPFKAFKIESDERADLMLNEYFAESKELSIKTHSSVNYIAHPKNMTEVREKGTNGQRGAFKVCDQYMIAGGQAWANNLDGIYTWYRHERHLNPTDPKTTFINLKQRKAELVGQRGEYNKIVFDPVLRKYYFDGVCPMDGPVPGSRKSTTNDLFTNKNNEADDRPF